MADKIDTRPKAVDISHYGGDTLTIKVTAPEAVTTGMVWNAQVRANRDVDTPVDATFVITPPNPPGDLSAYVVLTSADCRRLVGTGVIARRATGRAGATTAVRRYIGVFDVQISHASAPDPVITLVQGTLTLDMDVTRVASP